MDDTPDNPDPQLSENAERLLEDLFDMDGGSADLCVRFLQAMIAQVRKHERDEGIDLDGIAMVYTGTKGGARLVNVACTDMLAGQAIGLLSYGADYYADQLDEFLASDEPPPGGAAASPQRTRAVDGSAEAH